MGDRSKARLVRGTGTPRGYVGYGAPQRPAPPRAADIDSICFEIIDDAIELTSINGKQVDVTGVKITFDLSKQKVYVSYKDGDTEVSLKFGTDALHMVGSRFSIQQ